MKKIFGWLKEYWKELDKRIFLPSCIFIAIAIFCNYHFGLNAAIGRLNETGQYWSWFAVFLMAFSFSYLLLAVFSQKFFWYKPNFLALLLIGPAIFAWKMSFDIEFNFDSNMIVNAYWNRVIYYPFRLLVIALLLWISWKLFDRGQPFYGTGRQEFQAKPYFLMLLVMVPLIAAASTQPDFQAMYPKLKNVLFLSDQHRHGIYKLLYELSYGSDFVGIELFFRGFLVLAFVKWAGKNAILPMALFYCTIHFGKPMGECISSFFGGIILGVVTYNTRTILGGLMVHLGIAWMMELGGYLGNLYW